LAWIGFVASGYHPKGPRQFAASFISRSSLSIGSRNRFMVNSIFWDERLKLPTPFSRRIAEPLDTDAAG
jgi:hypothetical protein